MTMGDETVLKTTEKFDRQFEDTTEMSARRRYAYQIIACLIANTTVLGPAMALGYSAVALEPLGSADSGLNVSDNELSWIASITAIATPIGCIVSSGLMRRGRRFAMITTSITSALGWLIIYVSRDVSQILTGRAICGIAMGMASIPATVYAAEIAGAKLRGIVVTWTSVSIASGILIVNVFGYLYPTNWRLVALLCGLFPLFSILLITAVAMPESPSWLRSRGRGTEAENILRKLNGIKNGETTPDSLMLQTSPMRNVGSAESTTRDISSRGAFLTMNNLKPLMIMLSFFFFQQFSGIFVIIYYAVDFTVKAGVRIDGHLAAILIGVTRVLSTIGVSYVSRKYGRRRPSIASGAGMTIFMGILSVYLWLISRGFRINDYGIIPVFSLVMYILTSTVGFLVMPFAMIGEIYPTRVKDVFSGLTTCFAYLFSFFVLKIYPDMLNAFDKHGVFLFYAIISFVGTIFVYIFLPETKGKTLQEIEELFDKSKNLRKNITRTKNICKISNKDNVEKGEGENEILQPETKTLTIQNDPEKV